MKSASWSGRSSAASASPGELYRERAVRNQYPERFAITERTLGSTTLEHDLKYLDRSRHRRHGKSRRRGAAIRHQITATALPEPLQQEILSAYRKLSAGSDHPVDVAVRSSATAEDLPDASFAGQQETYLNVQGDGALLESCKRCFASLFTDRAISYRQDKGFDNLKVGLSIGVQRKVRSDLAASGVMFPSSPRAALPM
jgi:pyruvate,water dikinase